MGRAITMSTNPVLDEDQGSVTYVVPGLPSWDVVLAPSDALAPLRLCACGRSGRIACARDGRRTCSLNCRGDEDGGPACQPCRNDGQPNDDLE